MRLIDVDELAKHEHWKNVVEALSCAPTVDSVKRGKWTSIIKKAKRTCLEDKFDKYQPITCSVCKNPANNKYNYCPNCGAKMDL